MWCLRSCPQEHRSLSSKLGEAALSAASSFVKMFRSLLNSGPWKPYQVGIQRYLAAFMTRPRDARSPVVKMKNTPINQREAKKE